TRLGSRSSLEDQRLAPKPLTVKERLAARVAARRRATLPASYRGWQIRTGGGIPRHAAFAAAGSLRLAAGSAANAHGPACICYDNGDGTITCEGGFSAGSPAGGVPIRVVDARARVLVNGQMDAAGTSSFEKRDGDFHVVFDAG